MIARTVSRASSVFGGGVYAEYHTKAEPWPHAVFLVKADGEVLV